jgi:histidinol-phosphate/aromatic aminotransferase/cobyric acid decarboxylase-like protein
VVVGSLTKVFACPGLRVGYVVATPALVRRLAARQPLWALNGLAAAALPDLLERADLPGWAAAVSAGRARLVALLEAYGLRPQPSQANYVLVEGVGDLRAGLARCAVLVRDCASFGLPGRTRVAVPDAPGLARLAEALEVACGGR